MERAARGGAEQWGGGFGMGGAAGYGGGGGGVWEPSSAGGGAQNAAAPCKCGEPASSNAAAAALLQPGVKKERGERGPSHQTAPGPQAEPSRAGQGGTRPQRASMSPGGMRGGGLGARRDVWGRPGPGAMAAVLAAAQGGGRAAPGAPAVRRRGVRKQSPTPGTHAKMVSSRRFLVRMVPGLCWASGWLANSGGQEETGLSRMACFRS